MSMRRSQLLSLCFPTSLVAQMTILLLSLYCFSAPFMLVTYFGWGTFVPAAVVTIAFFGINEVAIEIEDPFGLDENDLPLDQMDIWTDVRAEMEPHELAEYPETGMFIHGLYMEGARWDAKKMAIADSIPKELHPVMPVLHVQGKVHGEYSKDGIYMAPVYTTSMRGPTFVFASTLKSLDKINKWVLAGVCLLMNDE